MTVIRIEPTFLCAHVEFGPCPFLGSPRFIAVFGYLGLPTSLRQNHLANALLHFDALHCCGFPRLFLPLALLFDSHPLRVGNAVTRIVEKAERIAPGSTDLGDVALERAIHRLVARVLQHRRFEAELLEGRFNQSCIMARVFKRANFSDIILIADHQREPSGRLRSYNGRKQYQQNYLDGQPTPSALPLENPAQYG